MLCLNSRTYRLKLAILSRSAFTLSIVANAVTHNCHEVECKILDTSHPQWSQFWLHKRKGGTTSMVTMATEEVAGAEAVAGITNLKIKDEHMFYIYNFPVKWWP